MAPAAEAGDRADHPLLQEHAAALDRYLALLDEDQALRGDEFEKPDPARRRLRVSCNACTTPFCCNQRVDVDLVEALVLYRWAALHARSLLDEAIRRGHQLHTARPSLRAPISDDEAFFRRGQPCPFLQKGRCAVYRVRPWPCRTHYMAGNPLKCRDQLQPPETYAMDPDPTLRAELLQIAEDVRFFGQIEDVGPRELAEVLHLIEGLRAVPRWTAPLQLGWETIGEGGEGGDDPKKGRGRRGQRNR